MGVLDSLISKKNKAPKADRQYIYYHDKAWKANDLGSISVVQGSLVENVIQLDNKSYEFNFLGNPERFRSNYGWSFIENTASNRRAIQMFERDQSEVERLTKRRDESWNKIDKLE